MQYQKIAYERSKGYGETRQAVSLEVSVGSNENYLDCLKLLQTSVDHTLGIDVDELDKKRRELNTKIGVAEVKLTELEEMIQQAQKQYEKAKLFFKNNNLELKYDDGIPF